MRSFLLVPLFGLLAGCAVPSQLAFGANVRASVQVRLPPPPPPKPAVAVEGAPVVEFFGIPLDDAQDVIFVLDVSGSMDNPATGRLAQLGPSQPPPSEPPPSEPPPETPVDKDATADAYASDPNAPPSDAYATDPNAPPSDAYASDPNAPPADSSTTPPPATRTATKLQVAQEELVAALEQLPAGTRLNIVFFSDDVVAVAPALVPLDEGQRQSLIAYVRSTRPLSSTALVPAMRTAMMLSARRIVLLSDGQGNVGGHDGELLRDAREAMRGGLRIDTIDFGGASNAGLLRTLAAESGGLYQSF